MTGSSKALMSCLLCWLTAMPIRSPLEQKSATSRHLIRRPTGSLGTDLWTCHRLADSEVSLAR